MMSTSVFFVAFIFFTTAVNAQTKEAYLQKADELYERADYFGAAQCYAQWLDSSGAGARNGLKASPFTVSRRSGRQQVLKTTTRSKAEGMWKLAECYRQCRDYEKMEKWYGELSSSYPKLYPDAGYWYAYALRANGKLDEAEAVLRKISGGKTVAAANRELENIEFARQQLRRQSPGYEIERLAGTTGYAVARNGEQLVFTAADTVAKGPYYNQLFTALRRDGNISDIEKIQTLAVPGKHTGMATFTPDGKGLYFTQWEVKEGKTYAVIAVSHFVNGQWTAPVNLGANVNHPGANAREPFVSADGRQLLFSSDRPGGKGGYDLWCVSLPETGSKAWNIASVNTPGDEQAPFYNEISKQLVFSSNGLRGMGGFDLYQAAGTLDKLAPAVNMGYPVNSVRDDLYFVNESDGKNAMLSSDRAVDCCLELYAVRQVLRSWLVTGQVNDCATGEGIAEVKLQVKDSVKDAVLGNITTTATGGYYTTVDQPAWLRFNAEKEGYEPAVQTAFAERRPDMDTVMLSAICLTRIVTPVVDPVPELTNVNAWPVIYFAFDKAELSQDAQVQLDSVAARMQREPSLTLDLKGYTDSRGSDTYNVRLGERRAKACVAYLKKKGISGSRLRMEGLGKCCPLEDETSNPAAAERNRRVEILN